MAELNLNDSGLRERIAKAMHDAEPRGWLYIADVVIDVLRAASITTRRGHADGSEVTTTPNLARHFERLGHVPELIAEARLCFVHTNITSLPDEHRAEAVDALRKALKIVGDTLDAIGEKDANG